MALNLLQTRINPVFEHGALAAARLPFLPLGDSQALQAAATALQMVKVGTDQYQHPDDRSFVGVVAGRLQRGVGNQAFSVRPIDLMALQQLPVGQSCQAQTLDPKTITTQSLVGALFVETSKNFFVHADGSWVALTPDQGAIRGLGQMRLDPADAPATPATAAKAAPAKANATPAFTAAQVLNFTAAAPGLEDGFLMAALPGRLADLASGRPQLTQLGFVEKTPGYFEHPADGSWVAFPGQTVERGLKQTRFTAVPLNPSRQSQTPPPAHGMFLAAADPKLRALTLAEVLKDPKPLLDAGFMAVRPNVFQHSDGSFMAWMGDGSVHIGHNQALLVPAPLPLDPKNAVAPQPQHGFLQLVKTAGLMADQADLPQVLGGLGFQSVLPGKFYAHVDGSFIAIINGQLHRGVGTTLLNAVPTPPPPGTVVRDKSRPPLISNTRWQPWRDAGLALTKLPILSNPQTDAAVLASLGFVRLPEGDFWHIDGTWVDYTRSPVLGWKGYHLGQLPFNDRTPQP